MSFQLLIANSATLLGFTLVFSINLTFFFEKLSQKITFSHIIIHSTDILQLLQYYESRSINMNSDCVNPPT